MCQGKHRQAASQACGRSHQVRPAACAATREQMQRPAAPAPRAHALRSSQSTTTHPRALAPHASDQISERWPHPRQAPPPLPHARFRSAGVSRTRSPPLSGSGSQAPPWKVWYSPSQCPTSWTAVSPRPYLRGGGADMVHTHMSRRAARSCRGRHARGRCRRPRAVRGVGRGGYMCTRSVEGQCLGPNQTRPTRLTPDQRPASYFTPHPHRPPPSPRARALHSRVVRRHAWQGVDKKHHPVQQGRRRIIWGATPEQGAGGGRGASYGGAGQWPGPRVPLNAAPSGLAHLQGKSPSPGGCLQGVSRRGRRIESAAVPPAGPPCAFQTSRTTAPRRGGNRRPPLSILSQHTLPPQAAPSIGMR
jgi:hypothetical protein